jgi:hypothetical protein
MGAGNENQDITHMCNVTNNSNVAQEFKVTNLDYLLNCSPCRKKVSRPSVCNAQKKSNAHITINLCYQTTDAKQYQSLPRILYLQLQRKNPQYLLEDHHCIRSSIKMNITTTSAKP